MAIMHLFTHLLVLLAQIQLNQTIFTIYLTFYLYLRYVRHICTLYTMYVMCQCNNGNKKRDTNLSENQKNKIYLHFVENDWDVVYDCYAENI